ncbi:MAG TPA: 50S ribosomal protein L3 N(5)-glutamine methyltransferase [Opitutaceae bacterium]|nr:50S ribosomal protein L3 N(5)-glutamine methyltransferase [Opitutaceae bacterium]
MSSPSRRSAPKAAALFRGTETFTTLGDWLRFAVSLFNREGLEFAQGTPHAGDEALALVKWALHLDEDVQPFLGAQLTPAEIAEIKGLLARRVVERQPLAYLTGEAWLGGLRFAVNAHTLIPRSYFVELIQGEPGLRAWLGARQPRRILELCTGSGCLAILLAQRFPDAQIVATDLSHDALDVAQHNVALYGLAGRIDLRQGDLFGALEGTGDERFDLIVANPPYEPAELCDQLSPELRHEPRLALDGGADGMDCVRRIVNEARAHLAPGGVLAIELGGLRHVLTAEFSGRVFEWPVQADGSTPVCVIRAKDLPR